MARATIARDGAPVLPAVAIDLVGDLAGRPAVGDHRRQSERIAMSGVVPMHMRAAVLSMALMHSAASVAMAQGVRATAVDGQELAGKLCSGCHATDPAATAVSRADVPSFRAIANSPQTTPERLAARIILPHPEMPGIALTRAELRAIIDYIMTLRKAP